MHQVVRDWIFRLSLAFQLNFIAIFLLQTWRADQAMDKSGMGDLAAWTHSNSISGVAICGAAFLWMATIGIALFERAFSIPLAQQSIAAQLVALIIGWCLLWVL